MVYPVVMYGCESWTVKKAECWRTDTFELWCWRRLLRVPWTARRSNQSIVKEVNHECSLVGLILKLKLIWKDPNARKDWGQEEKGTTEDKTVGWHPWLNRHEFVQASSVGNGQGSPACCSPWGHKESDITERLNWTSKGNGELMFKRSKLLDGFGGRVIKDSGR